MADEGEDPSRPSFADFWKKSKDALGAGKIRFVDVVTPGRAQGAGADAGEGSSGAQDAAAAGHALDKAQIRRAQVRKAQTQHRLRKANYVKQLEMDVARMRDMMEAVEKDTHALLSENKAIRARIQQAVTAKSLPLSLDQGVSLLQEMPAPTQLCSDTVATLPQEAEPATVTVTLGFDEVLNAPTFYVSSPPCSVPEPAYAAPSETQQPTPTPSNDELPDLTPAQAQEAINFILALEHICRDHFHPSLFHPPPALSPSGEPTVYPTPLIGHQANGHTLMASSLALRAAPDRIFRAAARSKNPFLPAPSNLRPTTTTTTTITPPRLGLPSAEEGARTDEAGELSWTATNLTLAAIHGLASSLNPDDAVELAPVQAWFELVRRFGAAALMAAGVLEALKREFLGVVRCPHFGAVMERGAFESVVGRVLGGCAEHGDDGDGDGDGGWEEE